MTRTHPARCDSPVYVPRNDHFASTRRRMRHSPGVHVTARAAGVAVEITRRLIADLCRQTRTAPLPALGSHRARWGSMSSLSRRRRLRRQRRAQYPRLRSCPRPSRRRARPKPRRHPRPLPRRRSRRCTSRKACSSSRHLPEPGAEEGAGAQVHVKEPWRGYSQMTADEVIVHLADASPEELAAVALYEGVHRRRKTVLTQARRLLRSATVAGPAAQARRA